MAITTAASIAAIATKPSRDDLFWCLYEYCCEGCWNDGAGMGTKSDTGTRSGLGTRVGMSTGLRRGVGTGMDTLRLLS